MSEPGPGLPWYRRVVYVDDQVNYVYTSETQRAKPGPVWAAQPEGPEFWDERTLWGQRWQAWFNTSLNTLGQLYNQSEGDTIDDALFTGSGESSTRPAAGTRGAVRHQQGCGTIHPGGVCGGQGLAGMFATTIASSTTARRWDAEIDDNQGWKRYLEEDCISWLRNSLEYGKETLQRKVRPTAGVSDRSSHDGLTTLSCKVSGFYPRDITVTWLKNGESRQQETYSEGILPNGDGAYQTRVTMEIDPKIKAHYSCHVEHESLLEPLSISWG
ncbi:NACHT, LRR and PYD domains-containing protein 12-like [Platysternon megacephalum]|uniref:NACHT, LRR and PYD domains-containing protein 12-like n=1 Tax=Platysternon megacephalum TaxID=55544 RepID=A0A4D9DL22_9SAUR|nr:NACHT, LRR and PYD domains-containing protein 12-like [Platysternon megacephalum]